ncbi:MAG: sigma-54 dependent transcriptional regulator [Candidatus Aminicenantes bacterium]|nr:sigma-54 dependent transcriptional regulator [Candidatus Aminicenantes bacterium]
MKFKVLVLDDEKSIRDIFTLLLEEKGYLVESAASGAEGLDRAAAFRPDVLLLDMNLPDMSGLDVLGHMSARLPKCRIIIITAFGTIKNAVEATKLGAYAYLEKPVDNEELLLMISRALEVRKLEAEVEVLRIELTSRYSFANIVGTSGRMNSVFQMMHKVARVDGTVLITGESGTGKELVARAIHFAGPRKDGPFVVVNCGAIPRDLIESEFFGHIKGAFTDAKTETTGKFELAHRGTIFLDEIGDLSQEAQVKLLRALGEKEIVKVGGTKTIPVDVRVIAATHKKLDEEIKKGNFREDLYFRLAVLSLRLPPLRERTEDIPLLCEHFLRKYGAEMRKEIKSCSGEALEYLKRYPWPGNVRELENVIYEAMVLSDEAFVDAPNLPPRILGRASKPDAGSEPDTRTAGDSLKRAAQAAAEEVERALIEKALLESGGRRALAAEALGISRKTLFNKMRTLKIRG